MNKKLISQAASAMGKIKSPEKAAAARANGQGGGRPSVDVSPLLTAIREDGPLCRAEGKRAHFPMEWRKAVRKGLLNVWRDDAGTQFVEVR